MPVNNKGGFSPVQYASLIAFILQQNGLPAGTRPLPGNAAQLVHSRTSYLELPGAKGVRFLTAYATDPMPITAEDLFYTFQGVTNDGAYYISAFFPLDFSYCVV